MRKGTLTAMTSRKLSTWRRIWGGKMLNVVLLGAAFSAWSNRSTSSNDMLLISFMGYSKTSNRDSAATASIWLQPAKTSRTLFPPQCTNQQLGLIRQMLPNKEVLMEQSNCPHASWTNKKDDWLDQSKQNTDKDPRVAVFVGCNKGLDALQTLSHFSRVNNYRKSIWAGLMNATHSACGQDKSLEWPLDSVSLQGISNTRRPTIVHCIEAMPSTMALLQQAVQVTRWPMHLTHAVVGKTEGGTVLFPNAAAGAEQYGVFSCQQDAAAAATTGSDSVPCVPVPQRTLDSLAPKLLSSSTQSTMMIDYLSIDTEGHDWRVLEGAHHTLRYYTKYVEFEYHAVGVWSQTNLSQAIEFMASLQYVCYWAGHEQLWRITDCGSRMYDSSDFKAWSNVACVHVERASLLAESMEKVFLQTLSMPIKKERT